MDQHYYTENPTSELREKSFTASFRDATLNFNSVSGVFSFDDRIDKASSLLIENFRPTGTKILDVGCGYGAIGLFLKALFPEQQMLMVDINNRAVEYARMNANKNRLDVAAEHSDLYSSVGSRLFNDIVSNPPIAAGKDLNRKLIEEALEHLEPEGALWLVAFHNKGGSTLKKIMHEAFGNSEDVEKGGGIRVYRSVKTP